MAPGALRSQSAPLAGDASLGPRIDQIFAAFGPSQPGCGVGLAKNGTPLYLHGYGASNLEYRVPNSDSTVFESGSVAKQFTASAILALQADGKLSLDDDIRRFLPEVPSFGGQKITIRNLLTHTSGLRDQWGLLSFEGRGPGTQVHSLATTLDLVAHQKMLNFAPGSRYLYSNTGYALAALIVQRVSGESLDAFMQERFFKPLGMTHTQWRDDYTKVVPNRSTAYSGDGSTGYHQDMPFTNMVGNGGVLSTMGDLIKWNENLDDPRVGGAGYSRAMQTRMVLTNGRIIPYGLGLVIETIDGLLEVAHDGSTAGYRTFLARYPAQHVSVAVWCNFAGANPVMLGRRVADLVLTKTPPQPASAGEPASVPQSAVAKWAGTYRNTFANDVIVLTASTGMLTRPAGKGTARWMPRAENRFATPDGDRVEFTQAAGKRSFILIDSDADTARYEEVAPVASPLRTHDYVGTYRSDELDFQLVVAERDGKLYLERRPTDEFVLRPVYRDGFQAVGFGGRLRFARAASGQVTGFSIYADRVVDVRFKRLK